MLGRAKLPLHAAAFSHLGRKPKLAWQREPLSRQNSTKARYGGTVLRFPKLPFASTSLLSFRTFLIELNVL